MSTQKKIENLVGESFSHMIQIQMMHWMEK